MANKPSLAEQTDALLRKKIESGRGFPGEELFKDMTSALEDYQVFIIKGSLDDPEFTRMFEKIQTQGLRGDEVVLLSEDSFTCDTEYFVVLKYMQKVKK